MGEASIKGKLPVEVALSIAATVVKLYQQLPNAEALQTSGRLAEKVLQVSKERV
jgi:xanthine/CO dehydrogenase XdhC/CoxF family maturation factor